MSRNKSNLQDMTKIINNLVDRNRNNLVARNNLVDRSFTTPINEEVVDTHDQEKNKRIKT